MCENENILRILKKIKALADGVGNDFEKASATRKLRTLMEKHKITDAELSDDIVHKYLFKVGSRTGKNNEFYTIFRRIVYMILNQNSFQYYPSPSKAGHIYINCTQSQQIEIEFLTDVYYKQYIKEKEKLFLAFILKHNLTAQDDENGEDDKGSGSNTEESKAEKERKQKIFEMMEMMDDVKIQRQIEHSN